MRSDKRRHQFGGVFDDPWRKLLSIALALALWYYLDLQVTESSIKDITIEVVFDGQAQQKGGHIYVSLPSIEYSLESIQSGDSQEVLKDNNKLSLTLKGKKHLITQANNDRIFTVQKNDTDVFTDKGGESFVTFRKEDLRHHRQPGLQKLLHEMDPQEVRIVLKKNASANLTLTADNVDLSGLDENTRNRILNTRFEPETLVLRGPADKLKGIGPKTRLFHTTFKAEGTSRSVTRRLELAKRFDEWLKLEAPPNATFTMELSWAKHTFLKVPVILDTSRVSKEDGDQYEVSEKFVTVKIRATGDLMTELIGWRDTPVPPEWTRNHARFTLLLKESDLASEAELTRTPSLQLYKRDAMDKLKIFREGDDFKIDGGEKIITITKKKQKD